MMLKKKNVVVKKKTGKKLLVLHLTRSEHHYLIPLHFFWLPTFKLVLLMLHITIRNNSSFTSCIYFNIHHIMSSHHATYKG